VKPNRTQGAVNPFGLFAQLSGFVHLEPLPLRRATTMGSTLSKWAFDIASNL
jgi:hypothetical protein